MEEGQEGGVAVVASSRKHNPPEEAANAETFPAKFATVYPMIHAEVAPLSLVQLDFDSEKWRWSAWSVRKQLAHMTALATFWLLDRWGAALYPQGVPEQYQPLIAARGVAALKGFAQGDAATILGKLKTALSIAEDVVGRNSPQAMREQAVSLEINAGWALGAAHPTGVSRDSQNPALWHLTLEGTLRHIYYEETTHLYNIQRLKRAQGLPTIVVIPFEGYWAMEGWDRSEP